LDAPGSLAMSRSDHVSRGGMDLAFFTAAWAEEAPWDVGIPQPDLIAEADAGWFRGAVLEIGCGSGEHALHAANLGLSATGIDYVPAAIAIARAKATERGLDVHFEQADLFAYSVDTPADTIIDVGLFHTFSDPDRQRYLQWLHASLAPDGHLLLLCFSELQPGEPPPRRLSEAELRGLFTGDFTIQNLRRGRYKTRLPGGEDWEGAHAWIARITSARA